MRKVFLILALAVSALGYGQNLVVTPAGLKDASDNEKSFVVLTVEGLTAKQLFDNAIKYVNKNYKNPDDVIKGKTDGEYLKFDTYVPELLFIKNGGVKVFFAAKYTTEMSFKDGKVKYEIIELNMYNPDNNMPLTYTGGTFDWSIYNKKGVLKREETKKDIETYFNSEINKILESLKGKNANDNW